MGRIGSIEPAAPLAPDLPFPDVPRGVSSFWFNDGRQTRMGARSDGIDEAVNFRTDVSGQIVTWALIVRRAPPVDAGDQGSEIGSSTITPRHQTKKHPDGNPRTSALRNV